MVKCGRKCVRFSVSLSHFCVDEGLFCIYRDAKFDHADESEKFNGRKETERKGKDGRQIQVLQSMPTDLDWP